MTSSFTDLISERGFDRYQEDLRARCRRFGLKYELTYCEPTDNPAMCLDFESASQVGRVTVWTSGACEMEVLDISTGSDLFREHHDFTSADEFLSTYPKLVVFMHDAAAGPR